jgi:hypothetical protein
LSTTPLQNALLTAAFQLIPHQPNQVHHERPINENSLRIQYHFDYFCFAYIDDVERMRDAAPRRFRRFPKWCEASSNCEYCTVGIVDVGRAQYSVSRARGLHGTGRGGIILGAFMNEALANNWAGNRNEFNERAPANLARDLQIQFSKLMQSEVAATGREAIIVDIKVPERRDQTWWPSIIQSVREQCTSCDHALIISSAYGYTKGDRVLNPTAENTFLTARLADAMITGDTPFLIQRDFSNSAAGHEHYNDFRNDKRDHYAPLRDLPAVAARAIAKELR